MKRSDIIREKIKSLAEDYCSAKAQEEIQVAGRYVPASGKSIGVEELRNMLDASLDMWLTAGRFNDEFEQDLSKKLGVRYVLTTNSGSSANLLALTALTSYKLKDRALKRGDEVITVATGFPTTINPIIQNGLIPVFVDCELKTYNIDVEKIEKSITSKTKCIFLAHTLGNMYDIEAVMRIAQKHRLWVIEDSCDALGAKWNGKYAGTFGHIGTCSFYPAHHITMGEGGAVVTEDPDLYGIIRSLRDWGRDCFCKPGRDNTCCRRFDVKRGCLPHGYDHKYTYSHIGYNLKITDWQAAIGLAQLQKLGKFLEIRRENAKYLMENLKDLEKSITLPKVNPQCESAWFGFPISVKPETKIDRNDIIKYLEMHGVGTRLLFAGNILRQPMFVNSDIDLRIEDSVICKSNSLTEDDYAMLPNSEFVMNNTFWVGVAQNLKLDDMNKIVKTIRDYFK